MTTPVLFRRDPETAEVVAILPTMPANRGHLAAHTKAGPVECSLDWFYSTSPAEGGTEAPLADELKSIGYDDIEPKFHLQCKWRKIAWKSN